jgi:hypothetical protein
VASFGCIYLTKEKVYYWDQKGSSSVYALRLYLFTCVLTLSAIQVSFGFADIQQLKQTPPRKLFETAVIIFTCHKAEYAFEGFMSPQQAWSMLIELHRFAKVR